MQFGGQPTPWSEVEIEGLRLRSVSQILIQEIGAAGPENAEESARRACGVIQRMADQIVSADARIAELEQAVTVRDTEIARLETDLELARRDAERYRWIRDSDNEGPISAGNATAFGEYGFERVEWFYDDELDAAVDEARAAMGVGDAIGLLPH